MRRFFLASLLLGLMCFLATPVFAGGRCPIEGQSFIFTSQGSNDSYELTDFNCSFGPGCGGVCSLWYGNFKTGPLQMVPLDFSCYIPKDASPDMASIFIANLPCFVDANVTSLTCIPINVKDYKQISISGKLFWVPKEVVPISFSIDQGKIKD